MSELKSVVEASVEAAVEDQTSASSKNPPASLTLVKGDLKKYLAGEDELLLFKTNRESAGGKKEAGDKKSAGDTKEENEKETVLNYILFTQFPPDCNEVVLLEKPSLIMCFLFNWELSSSNPQDQSFLGEYQFSKLTSKNLCSSFYFNNRNGKGFEKTGEILKTLNLKSGTVDMCCIGHMPPEVGEDLFRKFEEYLLSSDESAYLESLCFFKEKNAAEISYRTKINDILKVKTDPSRFDKALLVAKEFHEAVVAENSAKKIYSFEDEGYENLILDDSALALDLARSIANDSIMHAIEACNLYNRGAYFYQAAKEFMISLVLGYEPKLEAAKTTLSEAEQVKKIREMRSKAIHAAFQAWMHGYQNTYGLEMLLKLMDQQGGSHWHDSENQIFLNYKKFLELFQGNYSSEKQSCLFGSLINTLAEAIFQYSSECPHPVLPAHSSEKLTSSKSGEVKILKDQALALESPETMKAKSTSIHPIVQWFSEDLKAPFPQPNFSPAEKVKMKPPETLKFISGNLEELLTNPNSETQVIFSVMRPDSLLNRSPCDKAPCGDTKEICESRRSGEGKEAQESKEPKETKEVKEAQEKRQHTLSHIVISRVSKMFGNKFGSSLTLTFLFDSAFVDHAASFENLRCVPLGDYGNLAKTQLDEIVAWELFYSGFLALRFQDGKHISFAFEYMSQGLIETFLHTFTIHDPKLRKNIEFTPEEADYFRNIFTFPISIMEQTVFCKVKEKLLAGNLKEALQHVQKHHNHIRQKSLEAGILFEDSMTSLPLEDTKMAFYLGEYLEKHNPHAAIKAFEIVSQCSPFHIHAKRKIFDLTVQLDKENPNPKDNRKQRQKALLAFFAGNVTGMHDQEKLDDMIRLVATQAGLKLEHMKALFLERMPSMDIDRFPYLVLGLIEPLLDKLYEYRKQYGFRSSGFSHTITFSYSKTGKASETEKGDKKKDDHVKGLDEDLDELDEEEEETLDLEAEGCKSLGYV